MFAPSTLNCTLATETLSFALATRFAVPDRVAPEEGDVIDTIGGVASPVVAKEKSALTA